MGGQDARQLLIAERSRSTERRPGASRGGRASRGCVGDVADDGLDEPNWPRSGGRGSASRISSCATDEAVERLLEPRPSRPADGRESPEPEGLAEHDAVLEQRAVLRWSWRPAAPRPAPATTAGTASASGRRAATEALSLGRTSRLSSSIRTVSTAYSGTPSARSTMAATAGPEARHRASGGVRAMSSSGSGSREMESAMRDPPAPARTPLEEVGAGKRQDEDRWPRAQSSRDSMKSSRPGVGQWRSSKTRNCRPRSAMHSKKVRHAANSSSRCSRRAFARAPAARPVEARPSVVPRRRTPMLGARRSASAGPTSGSSSLGDPGPLSDHLGQRPEADPLAVRERAALVPEEVSSRRRCTSRTPTEAALADAACPMTVRRRDCGPARPRGAGP